jgi:hypothetical protein
MSRDFAPYDSAEARHNPTPSSGRAPTRDPNPEIRATTDPLGRAIESQERPDNALATERLVLYDRDHGYPLAPSEIRTITELGKFRVIAAFDLSEHLFAGRLQEANRDIQNLHRLGLIHKGTFEGPESTPRELLTLSQRGHRLLRANHLVPRDQATYHGFVKPKEANHDADLYRLYLKESARIETTGGRNLRVILDYELKRKINRDMARFGAEARAQIAERHGLKVVRNRIPVPDLRIEYETRERETARVNLELVTEHYRGSHIAAKARAGFSLYTLHGEADHLRRVLDQHELTAEILSL